jgi:hypothetical protein
LQRRNGSIVARTGKGQIEKISCYRDGCRTLRRHGRVGAGGRHNARADTADAMHALFVWRAALDLPLLLGLALQHGPDLLGGHSQLYALPSRFEFIRGDKHNARAESKQAAHLGLDHLGLSIQP